MYLASPPSPCSNVANTPLRVLKHISHLYETLKSFLDIKSSVAICLAFAKVNKGEIVEFAGPVSSI